MTAIYDIKTTEDFEGLRYLKKDIDVLRIRVFGSIDFENKSIEPIDLSDCKFPIIIEGTEEEATIQNFVINSDDNNVGLFTNIQDRFCFKNIRILNCLVCGKNDVGVIVGTSINEVGIYDCVIGNSEVMGNYGIGGFIGRAKSVVCERNIFSSRISAKGLVGFVAGSCMKAKIKESYNANFIEITGNDVSHLNVFVGDCPIFNVDKKSYHMGIKVPIENEEVMNSPKVLEYIPLRK